MACPGMLLVLNILALCSAIDDGVSFEESSGSASGSFLSPGIWERTCDSSLVIYIVPIPLPGMPAYFGDVFYIIMLLCNAWLLLWRVSLHPHCPTAMSPSALACSWTSFSLLSRFIPPDGHSSSH